MNDIGLVIFDCDGVLVDSEWIANREGAKLKTEMGYPISTGEHIQRFTGLANTSPAYQDVLRRLPENYSQIARQRRNEAFKNELKEIPGADHLLSRLRVQWCLASNGDMDKIRTSLEATGLNKHFTENVFNSAMVKHGKPFPDLFLLAAEKMGVEPGRCLVIEDSALGVQAAVAAGMRVWGFLGGSHVYPRLSQLLLDAGAEILFSDLTKLLELG
jgi:HAD superfamily hydrolase (TIGR01509 family)